MARKLSNWSKFRIFWFSGVLIFTVWNMLSYQARSIESYLPGSHAELKLLDIEERISLLRSGNSETEIIFFPGALVEPDAYIPLANRLASAGYNTHIIKMPLRMASRGYQDIKKQFNLEDSEKNYVLGGHSLGGKMAAQFVYENPQSVKSLVLLGTSHPRDFDLSYETIPILKVYAGHDGLASVGEVMENRSKLPAHTQWKLIEEGNHSQFAFVGKLFMDDSAEISMEKQLEITTDAILSFLSNSLPEVERE